MGFLVLDAIDAREVMIAIRTGSGIVGTMSRTARVVVNGDLVIHVHEIECAIRTDATVNWFEPIIRARQEVGFLAAFLTTTLIRHTFGIEKLMVHQPHRGLM